MLIDISNSGCPALETVALPADGLHEIKACVNYDPVSSYPTFPRFIQF